jgi:hypothetical protein
MLYGLVINVQLWYACMMPASTDESPIKDKLAVVTIYHHLLCRPLIMWHEAGMNIPTISVISSERLVTKCKDASSI